MIEATYYYALVCTTFHPKLAVVLARSDYCIRDAAASRYCFHWRAMRKIINCRLALLVVDLARNRASRFLDTIRRIAGKDARDVCLHKTISDAAIGKYPLSS